MSCDVGKGTEGLENELWRRWKVGKVGEWTELIDIEISLSLPYLRHNSFSSPSVALPTSQLILQPFRCFTYVTAHSPTFPLLHLRHSSFSNTSVASPTSQVILQPFFRFSYVTGSSLTSPGEPPMERKCTMFIPFYFQFTLTLVWCCRKWTWTFNAFIVNTSLRKLILMKVLDNLSQVTLTILDIWC